MYGKKHWLRLLQVFLTVMVIMVLYLHSTTNILNNTIHVTKESKPPVTMEEEKKGYKTDVTTKDEETKMTSENLYQNKSNLFFVKTHKCGTSTMVNIFYLYGIQRKLNFVITPYVHALKSLKSHKLVPPRRNSGYNFQVQHYLLGFDVKREHQLLPKSTTLYTSIVRHPTTRFVSAFEYFGKYEELKKSLGARLTLDAAINIFLDEHGTGLYPPSQLLATNYNIPSDVDSFIAHLDTEFDLIMITGRFDESLVVLKEMMGWDMKDILYRKRLVHKDKYGKLPHQVISDATIERILKHDFIDVKIHNYFNKKLDNHIDRIGRVRFEDMVSEFQTTSVAFNKLCEENKNDLKCRFLETDDLRISRMMTGLQVSEDLTNLERLAEYNAGFQSWYDWAFFGIIGHTMVVNDNFKGHSEGMYGLKGEELKDAVENNDYYKLVRDLQHEFEQTHH